MNRRFLSWFWLFALTFAAAAFYRPAITAFTVCLPILVVAWTIQLRRAPRPGWMLEISRDQLALERGRRLTAARRQASEVRLRRRGTRRALWTELVVLDESGRSLLRTAIDDPDRDRIAQALQEMGWPLLPGGRT